MPEVKFKAFTGINNQAAPDALENTDFTQAANVDIDDARRVRRREGYSAPKIAGDCHSMFAMGSALYFRTGSELRRADPITFAQQVVDTGLTGTTHYTSVADRLYYSDGFVARTYRDSEGSRQWGETVVPSLGPVLETLHKTPPPPSQVVGQWNGRIAVGASNFLLYSDHFQFERFDPIRQNIPFDSELTLFAAITPEACVVGTLKSLWLLRGSDLASVSVVQLADYGAIPGTSAVGDTFTDAGVARAVYFATPKGMCVVTASGLTNLTGTRFRQNASEGSALYRSDDGNHQILFSLRTSL